MIHFLRTLLVAFAFVMMSCPLIAQQKDSLYFYIDLPVFEYPYNTDSKYLTMSMQQSLSMTKSFYYAAHFGIEKWGVKSLGKNGKFWSKVIMTTIDFAPIPFSNTWLHEEWHRGILTLHDVKSKNTHWSNSVKYVRDEDLKALKLNHPADMIREATAGNEGNLEFVSAMEKDRFFGKVNTWTYGLYWGNYLVNSFYLFGSTRSGSKPLVKFKNSEDQNIQKRDANGYDPINAVYDMFNPEEAYADRGIHPSGHGIDRYIEFDDLEPAAQSYLKKQFSLSFLNFLDPNLVGIDALGKNLQYNISIRHHLTSFGHMLGGNLLFKTAKLGGYISPKVYSNYNRSYFGLDVELTNRWGSLRLAGWQQPSEQAFKTDAATPGGLISLRITPPIKNIRTYLDLTLKSEGWVAGNPYLTKNTTIRLGFQWLFHEKS